MNKRLAGLTTFFSIMLLSSGASSGNSVGQHLGDTLKYGIPVLSTDVRPRPIEDKLDLLRNIKIISDNNLVNDSEFLFNGRMVDFFAAADIKQGTDFGSDGTSIWIHAVCCKNLFPAVRLRPDLPEGIPGVLIMGARKGTPTKTTNFLRAYIKNQGLVFEDVKSVFGSGIQQDRSEQRLHPPMGPLGPHGGETWVYSSPESSGISNKVHFVFLDDGFLVVADIFGG
jgi:hypothetical protein